MRRLWKAAAVPALTVFVLGACAGEAEVEEGVGEIGEGVGEVGEGIGEGATEVGEGVEGAVFDPALDVNGNGVLDADEGMGDADADGVLDRDEVYEP